MRLLWIAVLLVGCASQPKTVTTWLPDDRQDREALASVDKHTAICRSEAAQAIQQPNQTTQVIGSPTGRDAMLGMLMSGQDRQTHRSQMQAVFEGCMYRNGYEKVIRSSPKYRPPARPESLPDSRDDGADWGVYQ